MPDLQLNQLAFSKITGQDGLLTCRMEDMHGRVFFFLQPAVNDDGIVPDGRWVEAEDLEAVNLFKLSDGGPLVRGLGFNSMASRVQGFLGCTLEGCAFALLIREKESTAGADLITNATEDEVRAMLSNALAARPPADK
jgi:hypothetical protein